MLQRKKQRKNKTHPHYTATDLFPTIVICALFLEYNLYHFTIIFLLFHYNINLSIKSSVY